MCLFLGSFGIFTDISELDRTMGRVSLRKIFAAVNTADTDSLMGASVFIAKNPQDKNVSALLFSTGSHTDERREAQNRIENYLAKGGVVAGVPLDTHWQGMKIVQVCMFLSDEPNHVGDSIVLISNENKANQIEQYVRILKVETRIAKIMIQGKEVEYKIATYTINDPLIADFVGLTPRQWYDGEKSNTIIRDTLVADTGKYYGSIGLAKTVNRGDFSVHAQGIYRQLIPSAQAETPIVDVNAIGERVALVAGNSEKVHYPIATALNPRQNLYIGSPILPNSVRFEINGKAVIDDGGLLRYEVGGEQIATIDYQRGLIQWLLDLGYWQLNIAFIPAGLHSQAVQSDALMVTQQTQSLNYTGIIMPLPAMGSVSMSYMAQGKFYELKDLGNGQLKANGDGLGSGTIDYQTGAWVLTCGALPDIDTPILIHWATPMTSFSRADIDVKPAQIPFNLEQQGVANVVVTWQVGNQTKTATSNTQGLFTGDAVGMVNYATGQGYLIPHNLPAKGTQFDFKYQYGTPKVSAMQVAPDASHTLRFSIGSAVEKNSVELILPVSNYKGENQMQITFTDRPKSDQQGDLVNALGQVQGTINYQTGQVTLTPSWDITVYQPKYTMRFTSISE